MLKKKKKKTAHSLLSQVATSHTMQPHFFKTDVSKLSRTFAAATVPHPPVTRLETTRGNISIFSILIRISPGKAMIIITSGGRGDMCRSSIPAMEPRNTPEPARKHKSKTKPGDSGPWDTNYASNSYESHSAMVSPILQSLCKEYNFYLHKAIMFHPLKNKWHH